MDFPTVFCPIPGQYACQIFPFFRTDVDVELFSSQEKRWSRNTYCFFNKSNNEYDINTLLLGDSLVFQLWQVAIQSVSATHTNTIIKGALYP